MERAEGTSEIGPNGPRPGGASIRLSAMTEFEKNETTQATPGTEGAIAPAPQQPELHVGVGVLLGRMSSGEAA
ncbi:hypothetical protein GCM10009547_35330 [Sporichthya brevicatena]|uniref:Uncharacterized protein n=1 Tax=Sporichthya brevicatena TaxID=171442 RepID=A0ABP3S7X5_9ACTN